MKGIRKIDTTLTNLPERTKPTTLLFIFQIVIKQLVLELFMGHNHLRILGLTNCASLYNYNEQFNYYLGQFWIQVHIEGSDSLQLKLTVSYLAFFSSSEIISVFPKMRKCHWGRNRRCNLNLVSFYFTVVLILVSTSLVIWNFRDECFQFHMPPSNQHYEKCRQRKPKPDLITFEFTKVPVPIVWKKLNVLSSEDKNQVHRDRDLRTALGPALKKPQSTGLRSTTEIINSDEPEKYNDVDHFKVNNMFCS